MKRLSILIVLVMAAMLNAATFNITKSEYTVDCQVQLSVQLRVVVDYVLPGFTVKVKIWDDNDPTVKELIYTAAHTPNVTVHDFDLPASVVIPPVVGRLKYKVYLEDGQGNPGPSAPIGDLTEQ